MNPLLQDPGLAFHPPILYAGYVGFAVPFAFAVAALLEGRIDAAWGRWVRPWTLASWCLLTMGIALGSWWAYYELGWGGFWFWDPVENASLLPWLTGTALLHSAIVVEKREALKVWTVLLAIGTFSLSLAGTFLVRSGILNSVHSFANDPTRGVFILGVARDRHRRVAVAVRVPGAGVGTGRAVRATEPGRRPGAEQHPAVQHCYGRDHRDDVPVVRRFRVRVEDLGGRAILQRDRAATVYPGIRGDDRGAHHGVEAGAGRAGATPAVVGGTRRARGRRHRRVGASAWAAGARIRRGGVG